MRKFFYRILPVICCCAILSVAGFSQSKKSKHAKPPAPPTAKKPEVQLSNLELAVAAELNDARRHPNKYIGYFEEQRRAFQGNLIKMPNQIPVQTTEGAAAVDETVGELKKVADLSEFQVNAGLTRAARAQLADLEENSSIGHFGKDGSDLKKRLARFGTAAGKIGENICHRPRTARDVVMIFLVDDGVKSRSHRKAILSQTFKQIGVACGVGKNAESLCVIIFADDFKDKSAAPAAVEF